MAVPDSALQSMKRILGCLAHDRCALVTKRIEAAHKAVELPVEAAVFCVAELAKYEAAYEAVLSERDELEALAAEVDDMYAKMKEYVIRVTMVEQTRLDVMHRKTEDMWSRRILEAGLYLERQRARSAPSSEQSGRTCSSRLSNHRGLAGIAGCGDQF